MIIRLNKLKEKEVINVCNGKKLGCIIDVEIDVNTGRILRIILPKGGKCLSFTGGKGVLFIPWQNIERIGDDAILVRLADITESINCP